jgi:twitching motility protein PilT
VVAQALLPRPDRQGRVPVVEVLVNVPAVANLIREGKTHQIASVMQTGRAHGMMTFESATHDLIQKDLISRDDGMSFLRRRSAGRQLTGSGSGGNGIKLANGPAS